MVHTTWTRKRIEDEINVIPLTVKPSLCTTLSEIQSYFASLTFFSQSLSETPINQYRWSLTELQIST